MKKILTAKNYLPVILVLLFVFPGCRKKEIKPNILLITIDTLRRDRLGLYGYPLATSPFIDQLAKKGLVFKNTITPIPLTDGSHASILTSLHPLAHGVIRNCSKLDDNIETIAEVYKKNGYYTIAAVSIFHLHGKYNFCQGFDSYSDSWDCNIKYNKRGQRVAQSVHESLIGQIEDYLEKHKDKPLFIWAHYFDPHTPYINRKEILFKPENKALEPADEKKEMRIRYAKEIRYTDNYIKKLFRYLEDKGLANKMVACITADHGEQLGEHGHFARHIDFYSETAFVPLFFSGFKIPGNKIVKEYVSTMDIGVTLLRLANLNFEKPVHGKNLLDSKKNPEVVTNRDFLIIANPRRTKSIHLIDVPFSFILNFDSLYKYWYISTKPALPVDKLEPVPGKTFYFKYIKKSDSQRISIDYPYKIRKGLHLGVLRFDVKRNKGFSVGYMVRPGKVTTRFTFKDKKTVTITAYFPVTPLDKLTCFIDKKKETEITNINFGFIPENEFLKYRPEIRVKSNIFSTFKSPRKYKKYDELYDFSSDIKMEKNLLDTGDYTHKIIEWKKKIYEFLNFYRQEEKKMLGETRAKESLTQEEKEMLKSLGYL